MENQSSQQLHHICMIVQDPAVHGGIAAVTAGYYGSRLEKDYRVSYVESYCDGSKGKKLAKALHAYRVFRKLLREDPPELVHIHASFGPSFYREIPFIEMAWRQGIPVINHIHGSAFGAFYENASGRKRALVRKEYGRCARLIVLSEHWKEVLSSVVSADRIAVIPNYSVLHPEVMTKEAMHSRFQKKQVLYLGVITEGKGMREMPLIIRKTVAAVPEAAFVVAGVGDPSLVTGPLGHESFEPENPIREERDCRSGKGCGETENQCGVAYPGREGSRLASDMVQFPGWVRGEEKEKLLRESMVFLLPSHMEAMPMSILEAMGYGLPVVSTNVGGIPNLVADGRTGSLSPVGDASGMADALIRYLSDEKLWAETSRNAMDQADESFGFDGHLDHLEAVYREILEEKTGSAVGNASR